MRAIVLDPEVARRRRHLKPGGMQTESTCELSGILMM